MGVTNARAKEKQLQSTVNDFLVNNPALVAALDLFKVSNEQYQSALEPLQRPEIVITNSANDEA